MSLTQGLPLWIGASFLLLGISCLIRPHAWVELYARLYTLGTGASILAGVLNVLFGMLILTFHWQWSGWALALTLVGVLALLEGFAFLLFPWMLPWTLGMMVARDNIEDALRSFRIIGILTLFLSFAMLQEYRLS